MFHGIYLHLDICQHGQVMVHINGPAIESIAGLKFADSEPNTLLLAGEKNIRLTT